jgi:hypothetical protein
MVQDGKLKGLANLPEWSKILEEAQPFYEDLFRRWAGVRAGQYEAGRVGYNGALVFTYSETKPEGSITTFFTPTYDRQLDRWIWAAYQPSSRQILPLIDPDTRQPMPFFRALDVAWSNQVRTITK